MTPEERFDLIEAKLQFAANVLDRMSLRHAGIRGLYRKGVNRVEEMAAQTTADFARLSHRLEESSEETDKHNILLAALMDSQMRTEKNLSGLEVQVKEFLGGISEIKQTVAETSKNLTRLEQQVAETSKNLTRLEQQVAETSKNLTRLEQQVGEAMSGMSEIKQTVADTSKNLTRTEQTVASLAESVQKLVNRNGK